MKKIYIVLGAFVVVSLSIALLLFVNRAEVPPVPNQDLFAKTFEISREYVALRHQTNEVLANARSFGDYTTWNEEVERLLGKWNNLETEANALGEIAQASVDEEVAVGYNLIPRASAYSKQEISDVFDNAPAGKKIKTLATFLGVDAKKAFQILKQDQAQVEADAWNEAGDTFQKLETSAVIIKDAAKVTGFVGTIALTGGTAAIAGGSALGQAAVVVSGADLVLEITDDAAKIALGNKNKISTIVGDIRVVTEPASSILMIADLPKNLTKGIEKLNVVTFGLDQFNSSVQDGKVIGIKLPAYQGENKKQTATAVVIEKTEVENWLSDNGEQITTTEEDLDSILAELGYAEMSEEKEEITPTGKIDGEWVGTFTYKSYTPSPETEGDDMWCQTSDGLPISVPLTLKITDYGDDIYNAEVYIVGGANCETYPDGWDNFSSVWKEKQNTESYMTSSGQIKLSGNSVAMTLSGENTFTGQVEGGGQTMSGEAKLISTNGVIDIGVTYHEWSVSRK